MTRREKQRDLYIELINYQLTDHGVSYNDVKGNPSWYMEYKTTHIKEQEFIKYCIDRMSTVLKISEHDAIQETNWFILQWGLTIDNISELNPPVKNNKKIKGT